MVGCSYDDDSIWDKMTELEQEVAQNREDIATLSALIEAMNSGKLIVATTETDEGVVITFNDGSTVVIRNGVDGKDGADGEDGEDGKDGDSLFVSIEETEDEVIITLTDGRKIVIPKYKESDTEPEPEPELTYELRVLTFEDKDAMFEPYTLDYADVEITTWSDLIDDVQYCGALLYGDFGEHLYHWHDKGNTELQHSFTTPYWGGGGHAISNYVVEDYATLPEGYYGWYELQLSVPNGGYGGSQNFAIHNGYIDDYNQQIYNPEVAVIEFADGIERVIDHMWVMNTCYVLNSLTFGDGFNSPAIATTSFRIVATGYDAEDGVVGSCEFALCQDGVAISEWSKWDLTALGKVAKVTLNFAASDDLIGEYGLNCPAYFAYDNIAVRFDL